jgi:peptidoglycan/xylan/chitin deacetylase (PgdA/CDA1 family)
MFHSVDESGSALSVSEAQLTSLVRAVRDAGHEILPLSQLLEGLGGDHAVAFTFDDGFTSVFERAAPLLRELAVPATLFLTTGYVGKNNRWPTQPEGAPTFDLMRWDQIDRLHRDGWSIEAHGVTHADLRVLNNVDMGRELVQPIETIEMKLGVRPRIFAYPYGYFDQRVVDLVRKHYCWALTTQLKTLAAGIPDPYRVPRLDVHCFRSPRVHRGFGERWFLAYIEIRRQLRELRTYLAKP